MTTRTRTTYERVERATVTGEPKSESYLDVIATLMKQGWFVTRKSRNPDPTGGGSVHNTLLERELHE